MKPLSKKNIAYIEGNIRYIVNITETHQVHVISEAQYRHELDQTTTEDAFFQDMGSGDIYGSWQEVIHAVKTNDLCKENEQKGV